MVKSIRHFGICVKDIDRALNFYMDVLGFVLVNRGVLNKEKTKNLIGIDSELSYYKLKLEKNPILLELYYIRDEKVKQLCTEASFNINLNHMAITVFKIEEWWEKYKDSGRIISKGLLEDNGHKLFFMKDTEDNLIEIVEKI